MPRVKKIESEEELVEDEVIIPDEPKKYVFDEKILESIQILESKIDAAERIQELQDRLEVLNSYSTPVESGKKAGFLESLFSSNKDVSTTRIIFFIWSIGTWVWWAGMSLYKKELQPISAELAAVLGALGATKMGQSFAESKKTSKYTIESED